MKSAHARPFASAPGSESLGCVDKESACEHYIASTTLPLRAVTRLTTRSAVIEQASPRSSIVTEATSPPSWLPRAPSPLPSPSRSSQLPRAKKTPRVAKTSTKTLTAQIAKAKPAKAKAAAPQTLSARSRAYHVELSAISARLAAERGMTVQVRLRLDPGVGDVVSHGRTLAVRGGGEGVTLSRMQ